MSTATTYEPLRPVPPLGQQHERIALLLGARARARKTLDLVLGAPRGAWTYLRRATAGWLPRLLSTPAAAALGRLLTPMSWLRSVTAAVGLLPAIGVALTTPPLRGLTSRTLGAAAGLTKKAGRALWRATEAGLRSFGQVGARVADQLAAAGRKFTVRMLALTDDPRARLLFDACRTSLQVVGPLSRGVLVHRLLGRLIPHRLLRLLVEVTVAPFLLDGRIAQSIRTWAEAALRRVARASVAGPVVVTTGRPTTAAPKPVATADLHDADRASGHVPAPIAQLVTPADNRAGRRAAQRQEAQAKKARPPR